MRRKTSHQSKRKLSTGKRRPVAVKKSFVKKASPKFRSRGTVVLGDGSYKRRREGLLGWFTRAEVVVKRDARTGRFITYRPDEAIERTSKRFAGALKRLADK